MRTRRERWAKGTKKGSGVPSGGGGGKAPQRRKIPEEDVASLSFVCPSPEVLSAAVATARSHLIRMDAAAMVPAWNNHREPCEVLGVMDASPACTPGA
ncbi:hypothetical protein ISCGN_031074 [Ixodes scapularis]